MRRFVILLWLQGLSGFGGAAADECGPCVQAHTMNKLAWISCDAIRHKAQSVWNQEILVSHLETFVRHFEERIDAGSDPNNCAQTAEH